MFQRDGVNRRPHFHVFFHRHLLLQGPVEARPADVRQPAHSLDTQAALHRHQLPDSVVDAFAPELLLLRRRASIFCKASLKKSTSSAFSPSTPFSSRISFRSSLSRAAPTHLPERRWILVDLLLLT